MLTEDNKEFYEKYFQENSNYYINQMQKFERRGKYSFNAYAFFLGFLWMSYRKMYKHILILFGILIAEVFIEDALYEFNFISLKTYEIIDILSRLVWWIFIGVFANRLYISESKKVVTKILEQHSDKEQILKLITKKGGTSLIGPICLIVLIVLLLVLSARSY